MILPPELICMVKSSLPNQDLYFLELTCRYLFWCTVSNKEWQLRKCKLWNKSPSKIISELKAARFCSHVFCWKYQCQYLSYEDVRSNNDYAFRWAAHYGHLPLVQYLCEKFQLTIRDVGCVHEALRWAAFNGHVSVVQYLCEKFQLTIEDVRTRNNFLLREAVYRGHLAVVQYLCEMYQLTIEDVRSCNNLALRNAAFHGRLSVVQYLCETYSLTIEDVRYAHWRHLSVAKYLRQKYSIDE
jgi:hypothetical protein